MQNAETLLAIIRDHPRWTAHRTAGLGMNHGRAACRESLQARFGGGPTEKARTTETSPAAYPTRRGADGKVPSNGQLGSSLPYPATATMATVSLRLPAGYQRRTTRSSWRAHSGTVVWRRFRASW